MIVHRLTTMDWVWASYDDKQVVIYAHWRLPTPRFNRNHNDTDQRNQENLEPFERPLYVTIDLLPLSIRYCPNDERSLTRTPHAFIKIMPRSNMMVAGATPRPGPQYCVNIAAAMVRVTMLMQLASLVHVISKVQR